MIRIGLHLGILALALAACPAEVVDRMAAVVNKQVILQSELEEAARLEFLQNGKSLRELTDADLRETLDRLIDQSLVQQQMAAAETSGASLLDLGAGELAARMAQLRAQLPGAADPAAWQAWLDRYDLSEKDIEARLLAELKMLRFVDLRFRGLAHADHAAVTKYYNEELEPELRGRGEREPDLTPELSNKIQQILTERNIGNLTSAWLETLRAQAHIERKLKLQPGLTAGVQPVHAGP